MISTSKEQLRLHLMQDLSVCENDIVFLFSGMRDLGVVENGPKGILEVFQDYLQEGALIIPTFTYSWSNNESFDVKKSIAPLMGLIANESLSSDGFLRTNHPNFSVNIYSRNEEIVRKLVPSSNDSFGEGSIFHNLYLNFPTAKILLLGGVFPDCTYRSTFIHTAQQIEEVWYRYLKKFKDPNGGPGEVTQFVRFMGIEEFEFISGKVPPSHYSFPIVENFHQYSLDLSNQGILLTKSFGYGYSRLVTIGASIDCFREGLSRNESYGLLDYA